MNEVQYRLAEEHLWTDAGVTPTERFIQLPRLGVRVRVLELGDGPPTLFLHGGPNAGSGWAPLAARLPDLRCIVLDRPGTGLSERYPLKRAAFRHFCETLVVDVLDALDIGRAHLIGSSTGSDIALLATLAHPERVNRTVHYGCPGFAPDVNVPFIWRLFSLPLLWQLMAAMPVNEKMVRSTLRDMGHAASLEAGRISQAFIDWSMALGRHTPTMRNEMAASAEVVSLRGSGIRPELVLRYHELTAVQSPTYFLWGQNDAFGGPAVGRPMADAMPHATFEVLPQSGHLAWLDAPDHAAQVARSHLLDVAAAVGPAAALAAG